MHFITVGQIFLMQRYISFDITDMKGTVTQLPDPMSNGIFVLEIGEIPDANRD